MSEWSIEHAWKACVGETLPRVRIPLSPPIKLFYDFTIPRLHQVSTLLQAHRLIEQTNRAVERRGTQVHGPLCRGEVLVPSQLLNRPCRRTLHSQMRAEGVPKDMDPTIGYARLLGYTSYQKLNALLRQG